MTKDMLVKAAKSVGETGAPIPDDTNQVAFVLLSEVEGLIQRDQCPIPKRRSHTIHHSRFVRVGIQYENQPNP